MRYTWINSSSIKNDIYIPKYYDPQVFEELNKLKKTHNLSSFKELVLKGIIEVGTGHEVGKMAYGTGDIPFIRTSDIANWEIKSIPKQGLSEEIYEKYTKRQNVKAGDILLVRDGTYLIGTNCIVSKLEEKSVYQSHILKFRVKKEHVLSPNILFLLLNSPIVQRQVRNKQFTADIIDTIGNRFEELILPIPKSEKLLNELNKQVKNLLVLRMIGRAAIKQLPLLIEKMLEENSPKAIKTFFNVPAKSLYQHIDQKTTTSEFGDFSAYWHQLSQIKNNIFLPKYYKVISKFSPLLVSNKNYQ